LSIPSSLCYENYSVLSYFLQNSAQRECWPSPATPSGPGPPSICTQAWCFNALKSFFPIILFSNQHFALNGSSIFVFGLLSLYVIYQRCSHCQLAALLTMGPEFKQPWLLLRPLAACQEYQLPRSF
jgi:hypothetical protein